MYPRHHPLLACRTFSKKHFCVSEDYPCGEDGSRVNVCHYSARDGYKTFCVPEADSDVLAFYKKDYCGPCVRGFAEKTSRK